MTDWPKVAKQVNGLYTSTEGRPAYPPLTMVKIIILQQRHDASDTAIDEAVKRNALAPKVRAPVKGRWTLKRSYGYWRTRPWGWRRRC